MVRELGRDGLKWCRELSWVEFDHRYDIMADFRIKEMRAVAKPPAQTWWVRQEGW